MSIVGLGPEESGRTYQWLRAVPNRTKVRETVDNGLDRSSDKGLITTV